jgi:tol-pal system protein YbgF
VIRVVRAMCASAAIMAAGACFATRDDVRLLQTQMQTLQTQEAHADSERQAQLDRVIEQLGLVNDSLGDVTRRLTKFQGDVEGSVYSMGQMLIQIQELTGQSQRRLQELRAGLEAQHNPTPPAVTTPTPTPTSPPPVASAPESTAAVGSTAAVSPPASPAPTQTGTATPGATDGTPGPNQLYQLALDQLRRGSTGAARAAFQDLLRQYPNADIAPDAQFYVAETYAKERNTAAADSGYQLVVQRYPTSDRASQALFKHALVLQAANKVQAARAALEDVVKKYPRSDEAVLAKDRLRTLK